MSLFKSVKKKPLHQILIGFLWPQMSFKRLFRYLYLRLLRLQASPSAIASGLGIGVALSFTPLLGAHIILSIGLSWILRANKVAALLGTLIGTPWTLPFMLFLSYKTGILGIHFFHKLFPNVVLSSSLLDTPLFDFKEIYAHPAAFFLPTFLGSLPLGICIGLFVFFITYPLIKSYRKHQGALK
ncbi:MAG: hypothetical protein B7Y25_07950 [Alphaproteobacteria bacterium 16-39-46]|nr:MAG: hypothetical protein B7Y25_07950 [Alphaproteobacteria bacterium 16-39-46]OZA41355.1 MAG: hypothetical protein B7X84_08125 [Alphaproteobacteria bacterium 17-39-52]HQS84854.1 DUF2062 domain-containing protein [Alphaproteobacteria bacterium]HQS94607.1 DUF2062 domain-containing protein [Alphaproteobacteria bacterium]